MFNCELQIGGSDQWGNITAGIDLCRKKLGKPVFGLTLPLITNADGTKFGKTEAGAIWLDPKRTSVYKFYQFWINTDDRDVIRYLKYFTFLSQAEIESLEKAHAENPGERTAHRALAKAVTDLIHGERETHKIQVVSERLFGTIYQNIIPTIKSSGLVNISLEEDLKKFLTDDEAASALDMIAAELPNIEIPRAELENLGRLLVEILVETKLCQSKGQARKDIESGGIYVNKLRGMNFQRSVTSNDLIFDKYVLLRKGKKNYAMVTAK
jgi:tyrosyl-tRNA synthetase